MADVTLDYKLEKIKENKIGTQRIQRFVKDINSQISNYRLLAIKKRGTYLAHVCTQNANSLQKKLDEARGITNDKSNQAN